jgi:hypothetical protein
MLQKVFIPAAKEDLFAARIAKFSIERKLPPGSSIKVDILEVENPLLGRFFAPEKMTFSGRAMSVDPLVLAVHDLTPLMEIDMRGKRAAACTSKEGFDSSVMLMDCEVLKDWKIKDFERALKDNQVELADITNLSIPRIWNSTDILMPDTKLIHLTEAQTELWRDSRAGNSRAANETKLFGFIPRNFFAPLFRKVEPPRGKRQGLAMTAFIKDLIAQAYKAGALDNAFIQSEIGAKRLRPDILSFIKN